ncbi:hypothetical protein V8C40DRAFT_91959 [Trichoderma camerunense]
MILHTGIFMHLFGRISRRYMKKKDSRNYFWHVFYTYLLHSRNNHNYHSKKERFDLDKAKTSPVYPSLGDVALVPWLVGTLLCCCGLFYSCLQSSLVSFWDLFYVHFACGTYLLM